MKHAKLEHGRWALTCWLLTAVFLPMSYFYALAGSVIGWLVWLAIGAVWLYFAIRATTSYLRARRR